MFHNVIIFEKYFLQKNTFLCKKKTWRTTRNASWFAFTLEGSQLMKINNNEKFTAMRIFYERNLWIGKREKCRWNPDNNCWKFEGTCFNIMHIWKRSYSCCQSADCNFFIILISKQRANASTSACFIYNNLLILKISIKLKKTMKYIIF